MPPADEHTPPCPTFRKCDVPDGGSAAIGPRSFWLCGTQGQNRAVRVALKATRHALACHTARICWPCVPHGQNLFVPACRKARIVSSLRATRPGSRCPCVPQGPSPLALRAAGTESTHGVVARRARTAALVRTAVWSGRLFGPRGRLCAAPRRRINQKALFPREEAREQSLPSNPPRQGGVIALRTSARRRGGLLPRRPSRPGSPAGAACRRSGHR